MNAKPTIEEVKKRNSQLTLADLQDRFRVTDAKWIVWSRKGTLMAWADTRRNRKQLERLNKPIIDSVRGIPRNQAIKYVRRKIEAGKRCND